MQEPALQTVPVMMPEPVMTPEPVLNAETEGVAATHANELVLLADELGGLGAQARKISILGTSDNENTSTIALALARLLARNAKIVVISLSSSATLAAASADAAAPSLADLMRGEASFGQIITRDHASSVHLVIGCRKQQDRVLLQSPRLMMALDALMRTYDHVLLDAGTADDLPAALLTADARAIVVPDASMSVSARQLMSEQLKAVGFVDVTMLGDTGRAVSVPDEVARIVAA